MELVDVNRFVGYQNQMRITGNQLKAARALSSIEQSELAGLAGVSINTVRNMEAAGSAVVSVRLATLINVVDALKAVGLEFINDERGDGVVRLRDRNAKAPI